MKQKNVFTNLLKQGNKLVNCDDLLKRWNKLVKRDQLFTITKDQMSETLPRFSKTREQISET